MRLACCSVIVVLLVASGATGQGILRREPVAGPWGRSYPLDMVFDSVDNRLFAGGAVIDASSNEVIQVLDVESFTMGYSPVANKVYAGGGDGITVIDAATLDILTVLPYECEWAAPVFAVNTRENKVYFCLHDSLMVVDGVTDSVLAFHHVDCPVGVVYSSGSNKVYCQDQDRRRVTVVDGVTDSVVGHVDIGEAFLWRSLCYVPDGNKVYCGAAEDPGLVVIDCASDSIVRTLDLANAMQLSYNPVQNRLYLARGWGLYSVDCATDSLLGHIATPAEEEVTSIGWGAGGRRVYVTHYDWRLGIVDSPADTLVAWTLASSADEFGSACYNQAEECYYCLDTDRGVVVVVDCAGDSVVANIRLTGFRDPENLVHNSVTNRLYYLDGRTGAMMVLNGGNGVREGARQLGCRLTQGVNGSGGKMYAYDPGAGAMLVVGGQDTVIGRIEHDSLGEAYWCDTLRQRFYCSYGRASVGVVDAVADTLANVITAVAGIYGFHPVRLGDKAYLYASGHELDILDLAGDSLLPAIQLPDVARGAPAYSETQDRFYCPLRDGGIAVVDAAADTLLVTIPVPRCAVVWNQPTDELYVAFGSRWVMVFDCATNQLAASIDIGVEVDGLYCDSRTGHVYCSADNGLALVDSYTREVQTTLDVPEAWSFCPGMPGRLFVMSGDSLVVTIAYSSGVDEWSAAPERPVTAGIPTILRGPELPLLDYRVLDALGRDVTDRRGLLSPGVYFLKDEGGRLKDEPGVRKVILQR